MHRAAQQDSKRTSSVWSDDGDGTSRWLLWSRNAITELLARTRDAAAGASDRGIMALAVRRDTPAGAGADGDYDPLSVDDLGRLRTISQSQGDGLSHASSSAEADDLVVKASAGRLFLVTGYVASGEAGWVQVHDATSQPSNGATPELSWYMNAASTTQRLNIDVPGHLFGTGIVLCWSTTGPTLTAGSANMFMTAYYE